MYNSTLEPPGAVASLSPNSPTINEFRRRSFPAHIIEEQKKKAGVMATETEVDGAKDVLPPPPPYDGASDLSTQSSFWKKHFCKGVIAEEDGEGVQDRKFSFAARGSLIAAAIFVLIIIVAVICGVLATIYDHHYKPQRATSSHPSPVHQALLDNFPDPTIFHHNGTWYAFATNNAAGILQQPGNSSLETYGKSNVQLAVSKDFKNWTLLESSQDPLPTLGAWVKPNYTDTDPPIPRANVWAPAVLQRPSDGKFILYYSAAVYNATRSHCIGIATSDTDSPAGPYTPLDEPLACPVAQGGAIDPATFIDEDGTIYVAWKIDGNNVGHGGSCGNTIPPLQNTPIMLQKMKSDGLTRDGEPISILDRTASDGPLVEAPSLIRSDEGIYFLFFSSGCTRAPTYDVKYAWAHNITGPYTRAMYPMIRTGDWDLLAPGSVDVVRDANGEFQMALHARVTTHFGRIRTMYTTGIKFNGTTAVPVVSEL